MQAEKKKVLKFLGVCGGGGTRARRANKYRIRTLLRPPDIEAKNKVQDKRRLERHAALMRIQDERKARRGESAKLQP